MANDSSATVSQADMSALNTIPDVQIFVDVSSVQDVCSQWQSKISGLNINVDEIANSFKPLTNYGILTGYVTQLATAIASLLSSVSTVTSTISASSQAHDDGDKTDINGNQNPGQYDYGGGTNTYGGGVNTDADNTDADLTINPEDRIDSISYQDYLGMGVALVNILKAYDFDFGKLDDDVVFKKVKELLLSSSFISQELKDKLAKYPDTTLKEVIKLMNQNKTFELFTKDNIEFVHDYVTYLASINNKSYDAYLSSDNKVVYNDLYYTNNALTYIEVASKRSDFKDLLLSAFDGSNVSELGENNVKAIRNVLSYMATKNNKTPEEFITSCSANDFSKVFAGGDLMVDLLKGDTDKLTKVISELTK